MHFRWKHGLDTAAAAGGSLPPLQKPSCPRMQLKPSPASSHLQLDTSWHLLVLGKGVFFSSRWFVMLNNVRRPFCSGRAVTPLCSSRHAEQRWVKRWSGSDPNLTWTVNQSAWREEGHSCRGVTAPRAPSLFFFGAFPAVWMQHLRWSGIPFLMSGLASGKCSNGTFPKTSARTRWFLFLQYLFLGLWKLLSTGSWTKVFLTEFH